MLQAFDQSPYIDDFVPMKLIPEAKQLRDDEMSFLAFDKPDLKDETIEFQSGHVLRQKIDKSEKPYFSPTTLPYKQDHTEYQKAGRGSHKPTFEQKGDNATYSGINHKKMNYVNYDDTFAKTGIFKTRYEDVANPVAEGIDYNMDFGGKNKFKRDFVKNPSKEKMKGRTGGLLYGTFKNEQMHKAGKPFKVKAYKGNDYGRVDDNNNKAMRASNKEQELMHGMHGMKKKGEKYGGMQMELMHSMKNKGEKYGGRMKQVNYPKSYSNHNSNGKENMSNQKRIRRDPYDSYGYQELGFLGNPTNISQNPQRERVLNNFTDYPRKDRKENSIVQTTDDFFCLENQTLVNGECIPTPPTDRKLCPPGWHLSLDGRCIIIPGTELAKGKKKEKQTGSKSSGDTYNFYSCMKQPQFLFPGLFLFFFFIILLGSLGTNMGRTNVEESVVFVNATKKKKRRKSKKNKTY